MKKIITIAFLVFSLIVKTYAQNTLSCHNNTNKDVYFAYAFYDDDNKCWTSKGWHTIKAYQQYDLDLGTYIGKIYIHGMQKALLGLSEDTWGSGYKFCIDPVDAFTIRDADKINCANKAEFSERTIGAGINKCEFNP